VQSLLDPTVEPAPPVRRRCAQLGAHLREVDLGPALDDPDSSVIEMACWALGEREHAEDTALATLIEHAAHHHDALVREAAVAALGAIGDARALPVIVAATHDKPAVRRRAAVALAPFDEPAAEAALATLLDDRDWQTRQIAEDLLDARRA
jgi:HEAT repeat protein